MKRNKYTILAEAVQKTAVVDYPCESRVHRLRSFPGDCYIKRDDELGFGVTGCKVRKFRTLIPYLKQQRVEQAVVIGGAYSNNVLGIVQLLIENEIEPILFLLGDAQKELQGTHLLIRMLVKTSAIHWVSRQDWPRVLELAEEHALNQRNREIHTVVIPEGSVMPEAIPGAVTLALDIMRNENNLGIDFERIFIDAGTGFQAAVTLLTYSWLEKPAQFHIVLMADAVEIFENKLRQFHVAYENWLNQKVSFPTNYMLLYPLTARSFGSVNAEVYETVIDLARKEGVFVDPIYSAKLFSRAKEYLNGGIFEGNTLIVHSGGGLSLTGFQSKLANKIRECDE